MNEWDHPRAMANASQKSALLGNCVIDSISVGRCMGFNHSFIHSDFFHTFFLLLFFLSFLSAILISCYLPSRLTWIDHDTIDKPVEDFAGKYVYVWIHRSATKIHLLLPPPKDYKYMYICIWTSPFSQMWFWWCEFLSHTFSFPIRPQPVRKRSKTSSSPWPHWIVQPKVARQSIDDASAAYAKLEPCRKLFAPKYQSLFIIIHHQIVIIRKMIEL